MPTYDAERMDVDIPDELEAELGKELREQGVTDRAVALFQALVLSTYRTGGRRLPWRETTDPYAILVSEVMLQQTQVDRVAPKYRAFLERFPNFETLAAAALPDVLSAWQGLGYNRRAVALHRTAQRIVAEFGGRLPRDVATLCMLPGIGKATASAIAAYAFNEPVIYIETNVRRVFLHYFFQDRTGVTDREIEPHVARTLPKDNPREWYNALMDLGTALASRTTNPNRRSASYARQAPFEGSERQVRGQILRCVLAEGEMQGTDLCARLGVERQRIERAIEALEREGFIRRCGDRIALEGAEPGYRA
jgi:A/G-specific adenine glycosylase